MDIKVNDNTRPIHLDLTKMHFPITAIVSILHRISGVLLFLLLPLFLYCLHASLESIDRFKALQVTLQSRTMLFLMWIALSAVFMHLFAGIRHLFMDIGFAEALAHARKTAFIVVILEIIAIFGLGVWLW